VVIYLFCRFSADPNYKLTGSVSLLFRCDRSDLFTDPTNRQEFFFLAGFNYFPQPGFSIAPNVRYILQEDSEDSILVLKLNFEFKF